MHDLSDTKQLATLQARSDHCEAQRLYITQRLDSVVDLISGSDGLMARLTRVEAKLDQLDKQEPHPDLISGPDGLMAKTTRVEAKLDQLDQREKRHWVMLATMMPLVAVVAQWLIGKV